MIARVQEGTAGGTTRALANCITRQPLFIREPSGLQWNVIFNDVAMSRDNGELAVYEA